MVDSKALDAQVVQEVLGLPIHANGLSSGVSFIPVPPFSSSIAHARSLLGALRGEFPIIAFKVRSEGAETIATAASDKFTGEYVIREGSEASAICKLALVLAKTEGVRLKRLVGAFTGSSTQEGQDERNRLARHVAPRLMLLGSLLGKAEVRLEASEELVACANALREIVLPIKDAALVGSEQESLLSVSALSYAVQAGARAEDALRKLVACGIPHVEELAQRALRSRNS